MAIQSEQLQQAAPELREMLESFRMLADSLEESVFICGPGSEHPLLWMNHAAQENLSQMDRWLLDTYGIAAHQVLGKSIHRFHRDPHKARVMLEGLGEFSYIRAEIPVGDRIVLSSIRALTGRGKTRLGYVAVWQDVTLERRLLRLIETSLRLAAESSPQEIAQQIVRECMMGTQSQAGMAILPREDGGCEIPYAAGFSEAFGDAALKKWKTWGLEEASDLLVVPCEKGELGLQGLGHAEGLRSIGCLPLRAQGKSLGAILIGSAGRSAFSAMEMAFLQIHGTLASTAFENRWLLEDLHRERDRLREQSAALEAAMTQLVQAEKLASLGQLAAGIAHEINNPMGFIHSNLGSLWGYIADLRAACEQSDALQATQVDGGQSIGDILSELETMVQESLEGSERIRRILADLKGFARQDVGEWILADLNQGVESTLNIIWNELKYKAEVVRELGDLPEVECIPQQINQVVLNLLVNAAQAMETFGTIRVRTRRQGDYVLIEVADTGRGIPSEHLGRIFDPFFTTKPVGQGSGLGLSIAVGIIQKHHGRIEVDSKVGKGTAFTITLPVRQPKEG